MASMSSPMALCLLALASLTPFASALGQKRIVTFEPSPGALQIAGGSAASVGQILVSSDDYWGVIRAAGDLAVDFGRVTGTNFTISNGKPGADPAQYSFRPVDVRNNTIFRNLASQSFAGPKYAEPNSASTVIIAGTIGHSTIIDGLIKDGKINVTDIDGKWESFVSQLVRDPIPGTTQALVIAGSDPRGSIYGIYDVSEQIGVSPWYHWADVPVKKSSDIYILPDRKLQGEPSVKYRGLFLNDEQPGLSGWVSTQWSDTWNDAAPYNHQFYAMVSELLLRLRANYLWPTVWGNMIYTDDPLNQPTVDAYEIVLGGSHTEPMMRAQNEFRTYYQGPWAYNLNNATIDEYFRYGVERAKPYARNSLWTMAMRGTGDTEIEGNLGIDAIVNMLEQLVNNQRRIIAEGLDIDDVSKVPSLWCLYKEVQSYQERGLHVPEDITLLWADDNWGNIRRLPLLNETNRSGGAGVYYHFDYVGDPRSYKWINTIQLEKTAEQMYMAWARNARRIWIVNVGDLKPMELPISHFFDLAYDAERWGVDGTQEWLEHWVTREFGAALAGKVSNIITRYGMYAARRKYEMIEPHVYSVINYNEAEDVLKQWATLHKDAQTIYDALEDAYRPAFFEMILHPILAGEILYKIQINTAKNWLYAGQKRNSANDIVAESVQLLEDDAQLTKRWDELLDGKWKHMLDQTHLNYDGYWQQPMRNTLPAMIYVQTSVASIAGEVGIGVEGSNATIKGDDKWHPNSSNDLSVPPIDPYSPERYFEIFSRGTATCAWTATPWQPWIKLSQYTGTVGPNGSDSRVFVSVDWTKAPAGYSLTNINITTPCRGSDKYGFAPPKVQVPVYARSIPSTFKKGYVESDGHVAIEGVHFTGVVPPSNPSSVSEGLNYHIFKNYGRTLGGVGLYPPDTEKLRVGEGPALDYDVYLFSNSTKANVTLYISPSHNYLGDDNPLEYAVSLFPTGGEPGEPKIVRPVGRTRGGDMPASWGASVGDAVWGVNAATTTSTFTVPREGAYTIRIWTLLPSIVIQKVILDLGGVRKSYLGPPESALIDK